MARKKPVPRSQRKIINRGHQRKRDDTIQDVSVSLMDMDSSIMFYFENVIKPTVVENGETVKVPIMYSSPERWKAIQRDGFMRDKKRQVITPVITYRRTSIERDETVPQDKLDANDPHLFYTFEKKFSHLNRYDNFSTQIGLLPQREYYNELEELVGDFPKYSTGVKSTVAKSLQLPKEFKPLWNGGNSIIKRHALNYLNKRNITYEDVIKYNIGYYS